MVQSEPDEPIDDIHGSVLYIEDDPVSQALIEAMLSVFPGITLHQAANGHDGIRAALANRPDVILLDMNMPDMRGLEVVRALNEHLADGSCQVILLTAENFSIDVVKAMSLGAREYWVKPLSLDKLRVGLRRLLHGPRGEPAGQAIDP